MAKSPAPISFDWDRGNIEKNWKKHKVHFKEAEEAFFNKPLKIFPDKKHSTKERRLQAFGITNSRRNLTIFFTIRDNKIRVISARDQNKKERRKYE
ncbi:BrnT family toxin [Patescibacteria group bacterium]|nr:BrnT family toxin [Patescibacteria group bacterium]